MHPKPRRTISLSDPMPGHFQLVLILKALRPEQAVLFEWRAPKDTRKALSAAIEAARAEPRSKHKAFGVYPVALCADHPEMPSTLVWRTK